MATEQHARSQFFAQLLFPLLIDEGEVEGDESRLIILLIQILEVKPSMLHSFWSSGSKPGLRATPESKAGVQRTRMEQPMS